LIREQEASGKSVREFAESHGLAASTLYWWRSALGRRGAAGSDRLRLTPVTVFGSRPSLDVGAGIEVVLGNGRRLRVPRDIDADALGRFVSALERGC
jgi:transposase